MSIKQLSRRAALGASLAWGPLVLAALTWGGPAYAAEDLSALAPADLIGRLSTEVLDAVKADKSIQAGDLGKVIALVDAKVMPLVNFQRMTASAVGRAWRQATPEQKKRLEDEFKILLVRTYSGALAQVKDQSVSVKPMRGSPTDTEVIVRTEVRGRGDPIQLDYRLEKTDKGWRIYDFNVLGIAIVQTYQSQFSAEINKSGADTKAGLDALIAVLAERNKSAKKA